MGIDFDALLKVLENMSQEEMDNAFPKDTRPKGWEKIIKTELKNETSSFAEM